MQTKAFCGTKFAANGISYDLKEDKKDCDYLIATKMRVEGGNYYENTKNKQKVL